MDADKLKKRQKYFRQATASAALEGITQPKELRELDGLLFRGEISTHEYRRRGVEILGGLA